MSDPIGRAISDYFQIGSAPDIIIQTNYTEDETLSPAFFFRKPEEMPEPEQAALELCRGKVLDVGAAAGCHAMVLQENGFDVTALEKSELAAGIMKKRGVIKVVCSDVYHFCDKGFDTILLLMNGTGLGGTLEGLKKLLLRLKTLLNPNGQILIDSSDISYLFAEDDGSVWIDLANDSYFGEMDYEITYKDETSRFKWLFADFETLAGICSQIGLGCRKVADGEHFDYLAQLNLRDE